MAVVAAATSKVEDADAVSECVRQAIATLQGGVDATPSTSLILRLVRKRGEAQGSSGTGSDKFPGDDVLFTATAHHLTHPQAGGAADAVCAWLFQWWVSGVDQLRLFTAQLLPLLARVHLRRVFQLPLSPAPGIEALLLAVYNDTLNLPERQWTLLQVPTLKMASVYHRPVSKPTKGAQPTINEAHFGPTLKPFSVMRAGQQPNLAAAALSQFLFRLYEASEISLRAFCEACAVLAATGFNWEEATAPSEFVAAAAVQAEMESDAEAGEQVSAKATTAAGSAVPNDTDRLVEGVDDAAAAEKLANLRLDDEISNLSKSTGNGTLSAGTTDAGGEPIAATIVKDDSRKAAADGTLEKEKKEEKGPAIKATYLRVRLPLELQEHMAFGLAYCIHRPPTSEIATDALRLLHKRAIYNLQPEAVNLLRSLLRASGLDNPSGASEAQTPASVAPAAAAGAVLPPPLANPPQPFEIAAT